MRRLFVLVLFPFFVFTSNVYSQVKAGDTFVDVYYGFPDWYKYYYRSDYSSSYNNNFKINSTGHIGGRIEYMVAKRIGFGLDLWYVKTSIAGSRTETYSYPYNYTYGYPSLYVVSKQVDIKESLGRLTCLGRFIVHIGKSPKVDPYFHVGFGYVNYMHSYYNSSNNSTGKDNENFFPLGARVGFGMRVFFTENLGANVDLGLGGALFTTGLTYKFPSKVE